jgi:hypothetical protein
MGDVLTSRLGRQKATAKAHAKNSFAGEKWHEKQSQQSRELWTKLPRDIHDWSVVGPDFKKFVGFEKIMRS